MQTYRSNLLCRTHLALDTFHLSKKTGKTALLVQYRIVPETTQFNLSYTVYIVAILHWRSPFQRIISSSLLHLSDTQLESLLGSRPSILFRDPRRTPLHTSLGRLQLAPYPRWSLPLAVFPLPPGQHRIGPLFMCTGSSWIWLSVKNISSSGYLCTCRAKPDKMKSPPCSQVEQYVVSIRQNVSTENKLNNRR